MSDNYQKFLDSSQAAIKARKFNAILKGLHYHRARLAYAKRIKCYTPFDIECIEIVIMIYKWDLERLDNESFQNEVAILPAL